MATNGSDADWLEKLEQWEKSGKSGAAWAREQGIPEYVFYYWRRKLKSEAVMPLKTKAFVELPSPPTDSGILLEAQDFTLRIAHTFDAATLVRFLRALKLC
jgi:hypothetical protein